MPLFAFAKTTYLRNLYCALGHATLSLSFLGLYFSVRKLPFSRPFYTPIPGRLQPRFPPLLHGIPESAPYGGFLERASAERSELAISGGDAAGTGPSDDG